MWGWAVVLEGTTKGSSWVSHQFPTRVRVDLGRDTDTEEGNVVTQRGVRHACRGILTVWSPGLQR